LLLLGMAAWMGRPSHLQGQRRPELRVEAPDEGAHTSVLETDRGFAAVGVTELGRLGWSVLIQERTAVATNPDGIRVEVRAGTPFFRWADAVLQFSAVPYQEGDRLLVPLQLLSDFFPRRMPDRYRFDAASLTLRLVPVQAADGPGTYAGAGPDGEGDASSEGAMGTDPADAVRVVVIDAGHGGNDPGALGVGSLREKTVALGIARALAGELASDESVEVHLIRDRDVFVDLWKRGAIATQLKGERPGLFISIHANSFPARRSVRGYETYFLAEARTDDERRLTAIENAPLRVENSELVPAEDLDFILRDLGSLDHQHWSSLLAEMVQEELATFHPGPNRGVKQGPLAVITNALMPAVLIEVGYLSHREESRLLGTEDFQQEAALAVARAVRRFLGRYPPERGNGGGGGG
jgi:N-acetylmuramoyl-L-alanine amidase